MPPKKEDKLPHITLGSIDSTRIRGVGRAFTEPIAKPLEKNLFINKLNEVISTNTVKLESSEKTYFLLDLTLPYYNQEVQSLSKRLKLEVKSIINEFQILVATEKKVLQTYLEKERIHKSTLKVIKDIRMLESSYKIGKSLQDLMRKDVSKNRAFQIFIQLINLDSEEKEKCIQSLRKTLYSQQSLLFYPSSFSISCVCSSSKIKEISEIPFVKLITESPRPQKINELGEKIIFKKSEVKFTEYSEEDPTPICLIDSGVSSVLDSFVILKNTIIPSLDYEDNNNHGTAVASVAIFGNDLIKKQLPLTPKSTIISFKIDDPSIPENTINLEEAIKQAVEKYKKYTPIFNLSYNYESIPEELRKEMADKIDRFVQKENILLVNSAGNIVPDLAFSLKDAYPQYLSQHNVFCPSECRNIFSVGSISNNSTKINVKYSRHTRIGIPPIVQNEELDKYEFFKPEIHTFGGDNIPDEKKRMNDITLEDGFPVINNRGEIVPDSGTSYSAPLVSLALSKLYSKFKNSLKNSETYKAILLNQCVRGECNRITTFNFLDAESVGNCDDGIYLNFEGISTPHEKAEEVRSSHLIKCKKIKFFVPKEAESIDVVVVHSNNYQDQIVSKMNTKVILKLIKPSGTFCAKKYGNIGRNSAATFAHYGFKRDYSGKWEAELHIETSGIPKEVFDKISIRYGVSLKINIKDQYLGEIKQIYDEIYEKTESVLKDENLVTETLKQKIPHISYHRIVEKTPTIAAT